MSSVSSQRFAHSDGAHSLAGMCEGERSKMLQIRDENRRLLHRHRQTQLLSSLAIRPHLAELFLGPMLYKHAEADRSAFFEDDHVALVKLLFLASIKAEFPSLDSLPVTLEQFDLRWVLDRIHGLDGDLDEELDGIPTRAFGGFQPTGRPNVDSFIQRLISEKP